MQSCRELFPVLAQARERPHHELITPLRQLDNPDTTVVSISPPPHQVGCFRAPDELAHGGLWKLKASGQRRDRRRLVLQLGCLQDQQEVVSLVGQADDSGRCFRPAYETAESRTERSGADDLGRERVVDPDVLHHAVMESYDQTRPSREPGRTTIYEAPRISPA
jgi:hypothetical protein